LSIIVTILYIYKHVFLPLSRRTDINYWNL
jgi:hypothetical protein